MSTMFSAAVNYKLADQWPAVETRQYTHYKKNKKNLYGIIGKNDVNLNGEISSSRTSKFKDVRHDPDIFQNFLKN